jgi:hypothetical protein
LAKISAEKEVIRIRAEASLERLRSELESKVLEARALKEHPELLKVLQIEMIRGLAAGGARVSLGLDGQGVKSLMDV